jgi:hypothetical protein
MSILSIDLHSSKSTIRLSFYFQNVTYESLDDIYCSKFSTGCNPHVLGWRHQPCVSSLQLDVGCPVVIAAAIPDAMLLPTDECFPQEVPEPAYDGLTCPNMLHGIQIWAHCWPRNRSHGFALEVGRYYSWTMRPGVVIHIHRPCS